jgi:hypothetical protein
MSGLGRRAVQASATTLLLAIPLAPGCRNEAERRAAGIEGLRERAAVAVRDLERYCDARDSVVSGTDRGEIGWEAALEEVLRAPDAVNDYCAERGAHDHEAPAAAPDPVSSDTTRNR